MGSLSLSLFLSLSFSLSLSLSLFLSLSLSFSLFLSLSLSFSLFLSLSLYLSFSISFGFLFDSLHCWEILIFLFSFFFPSLCVFLIYWEGWGGEGVQKVGGSLCVLARSWIFW